MNLFSNIEEVHASVSGWCSWNKAMTLASIVLATRPKISLELGVWCGRSLIPIAMAHKFLAQGRVIAIDPWAAKSSVQGQLHPADEKWWGIQENHEKAFQSFVGKISELGLQNVVNVKRMTSDEYQIEEEIGLLSLDGNHGEQSIKDVRKYAPRIKAGGVLVADDLHWTGGAVMKAISLLPSMGFIELYRVENDKENWATFQKIR